MAKPISLSLNAGRIPRLTVSVGSGLALLLATALLAGCQQLTTYQPESLPAEFQANSVPSGSQVDLSQLVRYARPDERVVPGDVLRVSIVAGEPQASPHSAPLLRVDDRGLCDVPLVGPVAVAGLTLTQAEEAIRAASIERQVYRAPQVSVLREARRTLRVTVVGAVAEPGVKEIPAGECHLLSAIVHAGGLADDASSWARVQRPSAGGVGQRYDLTNAAAVADIPLAAGDVVMVEKREPQSVYVMGLVHRPQEVEIAAGKKLRLLDALAAAGGRRLQIADKVKVIRYVPNREDPVVIATSIRDAKRSAEGNVPLQPGDVVSVEETPVTFAVEMLQNFVRFGFSSAIPFF